MNYNYLKYFCVLAKTEHYTHASQILNISQPSLSHAIMQLEKELGIVLFEKQGRNIRLTKYGRFYLAYVQKGLNEIEHGNQFIRSLASKDRGTIDMGFIYTLGGYYIPNVMKHFLKSYPNVRFNLSQGTSFDIIQDIRDRKLDIGFCSMIKDSLDINYIPVVKEDMVLVVSKNNPLAKYASIDITTIKESHPWILYSNQSGLRPYINEIFKSLQINPVIACEVEEDTVALGLVDINYGISLMPRIMTSQLYNVKLVEIENKIPERIIYMASLKNRYMTPSIMNFINYMVHNTFEHQRTIR